MPAFAKLESLLQDAAAALDARLTTDVGDGELSVVAALRGTRADHAWHATVYDGGGRTDHLTVAIEGLYRFNLALHHPERGDWLLRSLGKLQEYAADGDHPYLIRGQPRSALAAFLGHVSVVEGLPRLEPFLALAVEHGLLRASFAIPVAEAWTVADLTAIVDTLATLSTIASEQ